MTNETKCIDCMTKVAFWNFLSVSSLAVLNINVSRLPFGLLFPSISGLNPPKHYQSCHLKHLLKAASNIEAS